MLGWKIKILPAFVGACFFISGAGFLAQPILTEDLSKLFDRGRLHTDNRPYLEFSAPRVLYSGTLNIDRAVADRNWLSPATRQIREAGNPFQTLLDLVLFAASANVPIFNILPFERLTPDQQAIAYLTRALNVNPEDTESRYYLQLARKQWEGPPADSMTRP